jgi:hypothetical protein
LGIVCPAADLVQDLKDTDSLIEARKYIADGHQAVLTQDDDTAFARKNNVGTRELFRDPLDPRSPPLAISWSHQIRPYPIGVYVLYFPLAMLCHFQFINFLWACRIAILFFVLVSGYTSLVLYRFAFEAPTGWPFAITLITAALTSLWSFLCAIRGFYDVAAFLLVILSLRFLKDHRLASAMLLFWLAAALHSRALWALPIVFIAMLGAWKEEGPAFLAHWLGQTKIWIACVAATVSIGCLRIALPQLQQFAGNNLFLGMSASPVVDDSPLTISIVLAAVCVVVMVYARDFAGLLFLACPWVFFLRTPQLCGWHTLFWFPLLFYCTFDLAAPARRIVWLSALVMILFLSSQFYGVQMPSLYL